MVARSKLVALVIGLVSLALVLAGCGSEAATFPTGKFLKSGTTDYGLIFKEDGTFSVFERGTIFVHGTYTVEGDVFTETSNDGSCQTNVSFTWTFDGTNLTFNYVGDPADDVCGQGGRRADFDNVIYRLSE